MSPIRAAVPADRDAMLRYIEYPHVRNKVAPSDVTAEQSKTIREFFQDGFRSPNPDRTWVMAAYLFAVLDEFGTPHLDAVDFVIPLPHMLLGNRYHPAAVGGLVAMGERVSSQDIRRRLLLLARGSVPFSEIVVFVPDDKSDIVKAYRDHWSDLRREGLVPQHLNEEWVRVKGYAPINAPHESVDFAVPDTYGRGVKHHGRG